MTFKESLPAEVYKMKYVIRMHCSRMRTAHLLTVSRSIQGVGSAQGGVCRGGCLPRGCQPSGCLSGRGVCPGSVNKMTDMCKNITLTQTSFAGGNYIWGNTLVISFVSDTNLRTELCHQLQSVRPPCQSLWPGISLPLGMRSKGQLLSVVWTLLSNPENSGVFF